MQIQEYVRLLSTWCDWNCHSRQFLLGSALLNMGEPDKACSWLIQAGGGIGSDPFLMNHLFGPEDESLHQCSADRLTVMYFLKVIHLFEQFGNLVVQHALVMYTKSSSVVIIIVSNFNVFSQVISITSLNSLKRPLPSATKMTKTKPRSVSLYFLTISNLAIMIKLTTLWLPILINHGGKTRSVNLSSPYSNEKN